MNIRDLRIATIEQLVEVCLFTEDHILQLSPGPLGFTSTQVELPGIRLEWNGVGAKIRSREIYEGTGLMFGFVLQSPSPLKSFGRERDYGYAVVWPPGRELEYVAPSGLNSLVISVDAPLSDLLGWMLSGSAWRRVPGPLLRELELTCRLATQAVRTWNDMVIDRSPKDQSPHNELIWRDRILANMESALEPWLTHSASTHEGTLPGTRDFQLVNAAERVFEQYDLGQSLTVDTIADSLGVSRRTLFHAFRKCLGLGPHAYLQIVRLHRLRDRLLAESRTDTSVTKLAGELGFGHMGRLSAAYRKQFGEYPRDTLRHR